MGLKDLDKFGVSGDIYSDRPCSCYLGNWADVVFLAEYVPLRSLHHKPEMLKPKVFKPKPEALKHNLVS